MTGFVAWGGTWRDVAPAGCHVVMIATTGTPRSGISSRGPDSYRVARMRAFRPSVRSSRRSMSRPSRSCDVPRPAPGCRPAGLSSLVDRRIGPYAVGLPLGASGSGWRFDTSGIESWTSARPVLGMFVFVLVAASIGGPEAAAQAPKKGERLADYFGFQPLEIYKLEHRIGNLMVRDLDGDKIDDIAVSNNAPVADRPVPEQRQARGRPIQPSVPQGRQRPGVRQADAAGQHPGEQGGGQHRRRRLQRRRQARPGVLRDAGGGRDPVQRGAGAVRQPQEDQHGRGGRAGQRADRRRPRPGRPG